MNGKINPKILQEQAALTAQASRIQTRANMFMASASLLQDYMGLTQRLLNHINELTQITHTDDRTVSSTTPEQGSKGDSGSTSSPGSPGNQTQRQPILG